MKQVFLTRQLTSFYNPLRIQFFLQATKRNETSIKHMAARGGIYFQHAQLFSYVSHSPARDAISRQEQALKK